MPPTPSKLSQAERQVLGALINLSQSGLAKDRTASAVANRSGLSEDDVQITLEGLLSLEPPLVESEIDSTLEIEVWSVLDEAVKTYEGDHTTWTEETDGTSGGTTVTEPEVT